MSSWLFSIYQDVDLKNVNGLSRTTTHDLAFDVGQLEPLKRQTYGEIQVIDVKSFT